MSRQFRGADTGTNQAARLNRKRPTPAEAVLWEALRGRRLAGLKFRRQQPLSQYIVAFLCTERRLVVEVNGDYHKEQAEYDDSRTDYLVAMGYRVLRFSNEHVLNDLDAVLSAIESAPASAKP